MLTRRVTLATTVTLAAGATLLTDAHAQIGVQRERNAPEVYAITNARIVPVAGAPIEKGTIVIRNGVITAVGASAAVPGDARTIDGAGLTVYPGFIDAYGSLGIPSPSAQGGGGGRGGGAPTAFTGGPQVSAASAPNSLHPAGQQPEISAVDLLKPDAEAMTGPQSAGLTAALTAPSSGIFMGRSAVINLAGSTTQDMLIKSPVAMHIGFNAVRGGGYPNSLLGVFSALRQMLLDAQRYGEVESAYAKNPRGMRRPENDPSLAALQPVLARQMPVIMLASSQREIERALDLAKEFNVRPIIAGGSEAYLVADRLKAENVPVLLSVNFPKRPTNASPDADPEPLRVLRERAEAPKGPAKLAQAGVKFAFESGGISNWADFDANIASAVTNGLTADQALRALTIAPAELFGVSDRLGTIEVGKIANLTISRGDIFTGGRVTQLFIDGKPVEARAPTTANAASMAGGSWTLTVTLDIGEKPITVALIQEGDRVRGTLQGALGSAQISDGSVSATGELRFTASITLPSATEEATFAGQINGNAVRGTVQIVGHPPGTFVGTRPAADGAPGQQGRGRRPPQH
ncbi:MAG: amidohydrolase family protein [Gemmatimonadota bacterium]|nr:amidohydrolase family protein [Gemmatimonadota bacterium]